MKLRLSIVCFVVGILQMSHAEFTADDCWSLGFNKANLLCSSCDQLKNFQLEMLKDHCKECCHQDENVSVAKKYAKAVLEVCTCKFGAYPQIQAFIKNPIIKLFDKDGHLKETLAIDKWNTDSVEEFLNTYLEKVEEDDYLRTNRV
ncbi:uncharacterized protein CBL_02695 [Carabus blaptoides fortunei]